MKKLKILYISGGFYTRPPGVTGLFGGAEISFNNLAKKFKEQGHEIIYIAALEHPGFKNYIYKRFRPFYPFELYDIYLSNFIKKIIKKEKPDIIHANDRFTIIPSIIAAKKMKTPVAIHIRDFTLIFPTIGLPWHPRYGYFDSFNYTNLIKTSSTKRILFDLYKYLYLKRKYKLINKADAKITVSKIIKAWLEKCGITESEITPLPIFSTDFTHQCKISKKILRKEFKIPEKEKVILFIGNLDLGKGVEILINLINKSKKRLKDSTFLIAGIGYPRDPFQEKIIKEAEINKKVRYLGLVPHKNIAKVYRTSDIVLFPSKLEPLGRITIEAMTMGKPVIGSDKGGIKDVIKNNVNGLLADPTNVEEWIKAINKLNQNPNLIKKFNKNSKRTLKKYSFDNSYKETLKIYKSLIKDK